MLFCHIISFRTAFRHSVSALAFVCGVATSFAQPPQAPQPISLVQLAELPRVFDPQLSPDGTAVVFLLRTPDWTPRRFAFHLLRQSTARGPPLAPPPRRL